MRILLIDDNLYRREALRAHLERGRHVIVGEADDAWGGRDLFTNLRPDAVCIDLHVAGNDQGQGVREIHHLDPDTVIIGLYDPQQAPVRQQALTNGATYTFERLPDEGKLLRALQRSAFDDRGASFIARVLIVDDSPFTIRQLRRLIEESGHKVCGETLTGLEAITAYSELKPDLVLMDLNMPGLSGTDAVRTLMRRDPGAKIILCSASPDKTRIIEAMQSGAKDFLIKPIDRERIDQAIRRALGMPQLG
jgi:two-component system chemotaxis response regulator CheY